MEECFTDSLIEDAVQFLDVTGNIQRIRDTARKFLSMSKELLVYKFEVVVDAIKLMDLNASLGNLLIFHPSNADALFKKVVCIIIKELGLLLPCISENQITVRTKLTSLPRSRATEVKTYNQLSTCGKGYVCCTGVVVGKTETSKYTQSTQYICTDKSCEGSEENHFIRIHVPGALEIETIRKDFKCRFCGQILEEVVSCRHLSDKMMAEVIPESYLKCNNLSRFKQQIITLLLRDELTVALKIGQKYTFIGIVRKDSSSDRIITAIEVNNALEDYVSECTSIPKSIEVYCKYKRKYNLPKMLAYVFGDQICPPGTYMKLKLSCLLSLASASQTQVQHVHVLAIGRDTEILHRLLQYSVQFTNRSLVFSSGNHLVSKVIPDRYNSSSYLIEGGTLLLASDGICYLGDVSKFKKQTFEKLQSALSSGKVLIDIDSKFTKGLAVSIEQPLKCSVWAYTDKLHQSRLKEEFFGDGETSSVLRALSEGFSIVQIIDGDELSHSEEVDFHTSYQTLKMSMEEAENSFHFPVSFNDIEKYLKHSQNLQVKMSSEAEKLLHRYYLATRKARNLSNGSIITSSALSALISMAEGHARLCLKSYVEEEDALEVILLYEESLTAMFGPSVLSVPPLPHIPGDLIDDYLDNQKNRSVLQRFKARLQQFGDLHPGHEE
ncbi:minichromosome maintenance domain-containing protein 2-like [Saccostrea echinata]|uniref:minichromosome maintenance domain-containing protein 2-like n=1 Tax=Saccostrea echinata TaxID=191078 RepID=UPI002A7EE38F|nr:minichromosome maintenance domain-containing protein 2-like [Saccostrea echinata]XP_061184000.1 minichromosome maintenance domain-containing protein 2-like [Saccostrea echinata]